MVFIGYESGTKGYRFFDPATHRLVISRDVIFDEGQPWNWNRTGDVSGKHSPDSFVVHYESDDFPTTDVAGTAGEQNAADSGGEVSTDQQGVVAPLDATPPHTPGSVQGPHHNFATPPSQDPDSSGQRVPRYRTLDDLFDHTEVLHDYEYSGLCLLAADEPMGVDDALEEDCWVDVMKSELKSIQENDTWCYADLPKGQRAIGLKWVYKVKRDPEGTILKHKARLVAKGYAQKQGVDYEEVFAPVARLETVRLILALATQGSWEVHHMDVKSAFLNGVLSEEVYVHQPPGFLNPKYPGKVLRLKKTLYGLKQAPRAWNAKLDSELQKLGFVRSEEEHAVYKKGCGSSLLLLGVYVDDLIICGPDRNNIAEFKSQMSKTFSMSDLGMLSYYLGMEVKQSPGQISICQRAYAIKIIEQCGMTGCNSVDTPMEQNCKLLPGKPDLARDVTKYRSIVGSLRYLVNTRPDIAFAVGMVSRFMESPTSEHWAAVKRIVRYVAGTPDYGCKFEKKSVSEIKLLGYSDSDHAGDMEKRKSTTGILFFLNDNVVTWSSQKQRVVSLSSCEA